MRESHRVRDGRIVRTRSGLISTPDRRLAIAIASGGLVLVALCLSATTAFANSPVIVTQSGDDAVVSTSLDSVSAFLKSVDQHKIDEARSMFPAGLQLPKNAAVEMPVDAWSKMQVKGIALDPQTESQVKELGAAVSIGHNVRVGFATSQSEAPSLYHVTNQASIASSMQIAKWSLIPQAALVNEHTTAFDGEETHGRESTRLDFKPELRRPFKLEEEGAVIEPFLNYKTSLGLISEASEAETTTPPADQVGLGVILSQPNEFKLEASTDIEALADRAERSVNSKVKLTVPLD